jgi:hypothetical protein
MYPYVETAAARKVMEGYSDGTFRPNSAMSRASAVKSLVIAAGWKPVYPRASHFLDVTIRSAFSPYIESAYMHGAIYPDSEGNFYPTAQATRADITQMVYGMLTGMMAENPPNLGDDQGP